MALTRYLTITLTAIFALTAPLAIASPKSVILIIGDGFDDQHVTMGRNYLEGQSGQLLLDTMPVRAAMQVETVDADGNRLYVADSANTATSIATGTITQIGRIGVDAEDQDQETVLESAAKAGLRTGLVTTASITDATPAAFAAHVTVRSCEDPVSVFGTEKYGMQLPGCPQDAKINGGLGSIAEQLAEGPVDVALGGGLQHFVIADEQGTSALDRAKDRGTYVALTDDELLAYPGGDAPLFGLFDESTLEVRWQGTDGRVAEPVKRSFLNYIHRYLGSATPPDIMRCEANPDYGDTPSLKLMSEVAINKLSQDNPNGFFLMIESASIDKKSHDRDSCGSIGEIEQLEEALAVSLEYAKTNPETLIIVTADHAHAAQIVPEPSLYRNAPVPIYSPGRIARIETREGHVMRVNYATNNMNSEEHTGAHVPLYGNGIAESVIKPFMTQRDLYHAMMNYLELSK